MNAIVIGILTEYYFPSTSAEFTQFSSFAIATAA